jgi:cbb3-type cytochrome oxidase subunit 3
MLKEVMANSGTSMYTIWVTSLFFMFFLSVGIWIFRRGSKQYYKEMGSMALDIQTNKEGEGVSNGNR